MFEFWFQISSKTFTARLLCAVHITSDCTAAGTIFGTTDVYELGFSYLSISIFRWYIRIKMSCFSANDKRCLSALKHMNVEIDNCRWKMPQVTATNNLNNCSLLA